MSALTSYLRRPGPRADDTRTPPAAICALITILFAGLTAIETNTSTGVLPVQTGTVLGLALCGLNLLLSPFTIQAGAPRIVSLVLSLFVVSIAILGGLTSLFAASNSWLIEL